MEEEENDSEQNGMANLGDYNDTSKQINDNSLHVNDKINEMNLTNPSKDKPQLRGGVISKAIKSSDSSSNNAQ